MWFIHANLGFSAARAIGFTAFSSQAQPIHNSPHTS
jgi:hypothetical protein